VRFFAIPGVERRMPALRKSCVRHLSVDQQRRGRAEDRRRRTAKLHPVLCLHETEPDGSGDSCYVEHGDRFRGLLLSVDLEGYQGRIGLRGIVPDGVETVTADYGRGVERTAHVEDNFFRLEVRRADAYPERFTARDAQGHVVGLQTSTGEFG
jgi:hypothetical protein